MRISKSSATQSVVAAARNAGGSHLTKEARENTLRRVVESSWARGAQVQGIDGLREKHVAAYIQERIVSGISARTLQNEISHIRTSLAACGRAQAAGMASMSTKVLGIASASREGTRAPATSEQVQAAYKAAAGRDAGLAAMVRLQQTLGLRRMEAIQAGPSLTTWERRLESGQPVHVVFGTKGGRERDVHPVDRTAALAAVREARSVVKARGGYLLPGSLRQAETAHRHAWNRVIGPVSGVDSHQLRMAFARDSVARYEAQGLSRREALASTSLDLGHGDGRGRWVERVYLARA